MPRARIGRHTIEYATTGDEHAPALVLIMGTAAPLTMWDDEFCEALGGRGFSVVRFDYRDTGRSTSTPGRDARSIQEMMAAVRRRSPSAELSPGGSRRRRRRSARRARDRSGPPSRAFPGRRCRAARRCTRPESGYCAHAGRMLDGEPGGSSAQPETMSVLLSALPCDRRSFVDWNVLMYTNTGAKSPPPDVD